MAVLSLASKVQEPEYTVKLGDVVNTCHRFVSCMVYFTLHFYLWPLCRCLHKDEPPLEIGDVYWKLKESVGRYELLLLRAIKFNLTVKLPHPVSNLSAECAYFYFFAECALIFFVSPLQYMLHYLLALSRWVDEEAWEKSHVTRVAWALLQDSFHTTLSLRKPPHAIATAVLYLAVQCCNLSIPGADKAKWRWWEVFGDGTTETELQEIAQEVMDCVTSTNACNQH